MKLKSTAGRGAWIWTLAGLLALFLSACSEEQLPSDSGASDGDGEIECPVTCSIDIDCCGGKSCIAGVCNPGRDCAQGCNWECDKAAGEICNQATNKCEPGDPPPTCVEGCDCHSNESCINAQCQPIGGDDEVPPCTTDEDCEDDYVCREGSCLPDLCTTREECAGPTCLVCKESQCTAPPPVCQGDADCCVKYECNFGTCILVNIGCESDSDCHDPDLPRCIPPDCFPECYGDIDCQPPEYTPGYTCDCLPQDPDYPECQYKHCIRPVGCTPEQCDPEYWCDTGDGICKPGCDSNDDCPAPDETCNYADHVCGQVDCCGGVCDPVDQYCDDLTCHCVNLCREPADCPPNYDCNLGTGKCICTDAACAAGFHCDQQTGMCIPDANECDPITNPCPAGYYCDPATLVCVYQNGSGDGAPCTTDADCGAGLLCDNAFFCIPCIMEDPNFVATYTCRYECSLIDLQCSISGYECKMRRWPWLQLPVGQCMPP